LEEQVRVFAAWTMHFQIMMNERPTKCIFKINHTCRSKTDILNIWFTLKMHFVGLSNMIEVRVSESRELRRNAGVSGGK
jgi:hypothetical protein